MARPEQYQENMTLPTIELSPDEVRYSPRWTACPDGRLYCVDLSGPEVLLRSRDPRTGQVWVARMATHRGDWEPMTHPPVAEWVEVSSGRPAPARRATDIREGV